MATCTVCSTKLNLAEAIGEDICRRCSRERNQRRQAEVKQLEALSVQLRAREKSAEASAVNLLREATLPHNDLVLWKQRIFAAFVDGLTDDGALSVVDEHGAASFADQLGIGTSNGALAADPRTLMELQIGRAMAGRLPIIETSLLMNPWKDEVVHWQTENADLMHIGRKFVRTYQGVSLPIGKSRVRYHAGMSSGRVVTTGFEVADRGTLLITSHRAVFMGRETMKAVPYSRLIDIKVFSDGMELFRDDRVRPVPVLLQQDAELAAVIANVAARQFLGRWMAPYSDVVVAPSAPAARVDPVSGLDELFGTINDVTKDIDKRLGGSKGPQE